MSEDIPGNRMPRVELHEVTDIALLPGRFEAFAVEVRLSFEMLSEKLLPVLDRLGRTLDDLTKRVDAIEKRQDATDHRLAALEAARPTKRKAKR